MNVRSVILVTVLVFGCVRCGEESPTVSEPEPVENFSKIDPRLLQANNTFAFNLFRLAYYNGAGENIFLSPLSISMALGMTMNGAWGETGDAMRATLALEGLTQDEINRNYHLALKILAKLDPDVQLEIANSIWSRAGFSVDQGFMYTNQTYFDAEVRALDFGQKDAASIINTWVSEKTHGKIEEIIDGPIPEYVVMYIINAVYFNAAWQMAFDENRTISTSFSSFLHSKASVSLMSRQDSLPFYQTSAYSAVDLPYGNGAFAMSIVLPKLDTQDAFQSVLDGFTQEEWDAMRNGFAEEELQFGLPVFSYRYERSLNSLLSDLGMSIAFEPGMADFRGISADGGLFISDVRHKTYVDVNERGTEAAAVTSVEVGTTGVEPGPRSFVCNRPFLYFIRDCETGTVIFMGLFLEP